MSSTHYRDAGAPLRYSAPFAGIGPQGIVRAVARGSSTPVGVIVAGIVVPYGKAREVKRDAEVELFRAGSVLPTSRPPLRLDHYGPTVGEFVSATDSASFLSISWRLREDLDARTVAFLTSTDLPLSVGFRPINPPELLRVDDSGRRWVAQTFVDLVEVAVVADPAYPEAQLWSRRPGGAS